MTLVSAAFTDEFRDFVNSNVSKEMVRFLTDLQAEIDDRFLTLSVSSDKEQLYILSKQREALQLLLTSLTNIEE